MKSVSAAYEEHTPPPESNLTISPPTDTTDTRTSKRKRAARKVASFDWNTIKTLNVRDELCSLFSG